LAYPNATSDDDGPAGERHALTEELRDVVQWHAVWAVAVLLACAGLAVALEGAPRSAELALLVGAAPGVAGLLLRRADETRWRAVLLAVWAGCGAGACMLAGGVSGPLAVWCLAPVAAAAAFAGTGLLAESAALALIAAGANALVGLTGLLPGRPPAPADSWLAFVGLVTTGLGLASGLALSRRRAARLGAQRRAAEGDLEQLLEGQASLVLSLDGSGQVLAAFGRAPEGLGPGPLVGRSLLGLAEEGALPELRAAVAAAAAGASVETGFAPRLAPDRTCALALARAGSGRLVATLRDASAEASRIAELEAAREAAESLNAGKSRFIANMSHELRTPLNAIMGFSDVMKSRLFGDLQPRYVEYAEMIHDAGRHLLDLINDVLDISKIEAERYELRKEPFDAREAVSGALRLTRLQADSAGVALRGLLPPAPLEVEADPRAIKQIVLNLISNALKFTPRGGAVTVSLGGHGQDIEIVVSDTGVGIAAADLERIGRPYEQAGDADQKTLGTGLGLSLVRAFSELHGGGMTIESRLGEGTSVTVRMPVLRAAPPGPHGANVIPFNPAAERR
jgi:cell cycle sensor histidine kinase DivJ